MNKITTLASTTVNGSDTITVQLIRAEDMPAVNRTVHVGIVRVVWPVAPTIIEAKHFPDVAAAIVRMFATASTELSRIKAWKRPL